ncbi:FPP/GGPP synthase family protein [Aspergillus brunneoviolaceus CBS 621.78]|uniref:Terpenoid synthase n=1 Tax=Aspergillus brunneoviolaceus CBS 621.78 TaxID=1450534 RepID=A0ACD1G7U4_9EURO|nr:terpenoid synthase [Aspergillus brunneoviolaceus CBS 621.78]RAH45305.1 terpenoid synthase [Aspergillus brunneoviolaceus CBS 621.78]
MEPHASQQNSTDHEQSPVVSKPLRQTLLAPFNPATATATAEKLCTAPIEYTQSLPGKNTLASFIDSLTVWFPIRDEYTAPLREITATLFTTILILDDIEDSSPLRRGHPSAHAKFGTGPTVNAATYTLMTLTASIQKHLGAEALDIFLEEMQNLGKGQALDLHWTCVRECPTVEEYLGMVDLKTGSLFRLVVRWMALGAGREVDEEVAGLVTLLGRYYQVRDDLLNLSGEYWVSKGWCEDLDEGKFSFPLVWLLRVQAGEVGEEVYGLLFGEAGGRREAGGVSDEVKGRVVELLKGAGTLEGTVRVLEEILEGILAVLGGLEGRLGVNAGLRGLVSRLRI